MKTELFLTDGHVPDINDTAMLKLLEYIGNRKIDILTLGGDMIDLKSISTFPHDPGGPTVQDELESFLEFLGFLDEVLDPEEKYYISGNHERRFEKYMWTRAPKLSGLDTMTFPELFRLADYGYGYIDNRELLQQTGAPFQIGDLYHLHGDELGIGANSINVARIALRKGIENCIFGHFHRSDEAYQKGLNGDVCGAWAVGTLGPLSEGYASVNNWNHGFAVITYYDDGYFKVENMKIIDGRVV